MFKHCFDIPKVESIQEIKSISVPLLMEVSLFFAPNKKTASDNETPSRKEYSKVNCKLFRLGNILNGIYKYVQVQFTNEYSSMLEINVHSVVKEIKI